VPLVQQIDASGGSWRPSVIESRSAMC